MNTEKFREKVARRLSFYEKAIEHIEELKAMRQTNTILTQYLAGLVLEHGGNISADNWARVNAKDELIPSRLSVTDSGVCISVRLDEEAPA